jgi:hypothetical protein
MQHKEDFISKVQKQRCVLCEQRHGTIWHCCTCVVDAKAFWLLACLTVPYLALPSEPVVYTSNITISVYETLATAAMTAAGSQRSNCPPSTPTCILSNFIIATLWHWRTINCVPHSTAIGSRSASGLWALDGGHLSRQIETKQVIMSPVLYALEVSVGWNHFIISGFITS